MITRISHILSFCLLFTLVIIPFIASAATVNLAWDPNTEEDLVGYKVYYGYSSGDYDTSVDVGNTTTVQIAGLEDDQTYYFAATAYDTSGLESDYSNEVSGVAEPADEEPPTVTITQPTSGDSYSTDQNSINMGGSASDNVGITSVTWVNDRGGSGTASGTDSWTISNISLQIGNNVITVTAHDAAGNTGQDILTVTYSPSPIPDTIDPTVTITSPTSGSTYSTDQATVTLGGSASDNVGVTSVSWVNNRGGSGTASGTTNWTLSNISLQEGNNVITVTARDAAGNTGTDSLTVTYNIDPTVTITQPTSGTTYFTEQNPINMGGTASDNVGVTTVTWTNNRGGSGTASGTDNWTISNISLQIGNNVITVTAHDAAGNTGQDMLTVTYAQTTRYVDPSSPSPGGGYTSWVTAAHDISTALAAMSVGDILIIRDGTYTGAENMITAGSIPNGTADAYTVVRAENDFGVIIDAEGEDNRGPITIGSSDEYIEIHGIEGRNSGDFGSNQGASVVHIEGDYIKMFRCGASECAEQGVDEVEGDMSSVFFITDASYVLLEECYAWAWGKYGFLVDSSDHCILRRCVSRQDGWAWGAGGCFGNYSSTDTESQNCIAIDFDEPSHWHPQVNDGLRGGFNINGTCSNIAYRGCIAINITGTNGVTIKDADGSSHDANYNPGWRLGSTGNTTSMENCVGVGCVGGVMTYDATTITNCTFVDIFNDDEPATFAQGGLGVVRISGDEPVVTNTVFVDIESVAVTNISNSSDYNAYDANTTNYSGSPFGPHDYSSEAPNDEINVQWSADNLNGGLMYPVRIEAGSNLSGKGKDGADIGANILQRYGASGTLHGDPDYNTLGADSRPLWPFPNESIIRERMRVYNGWDPYDNIHPNDADDPDTWVKGDRSFCADGETLTNYIWGYFGTILPPFNIQAVAGDGKITLTWNPCTYDDITHYYNVYYGTTSGIYDYSLLGVDTTTATITDLTNDITYYFVVTTGGSESGYSYEVSATPAASQSGEGDGSEAGDSGGGSAGSAAAGSASGGGGGGCFIATAAYGSRLEPHVKVLQDFRDRYLLTNIPGRAFVSLYYRVSPPLAEVIREHETLRTIVRWGLTPLVWGIEHPWFFVLGCLLLVVFGIGSTIVVVRLTHRSC